MNMEMVLFPVLFLGGVFLSGREMRRRLDEKLLKQRREFENEHERLVQKRRDQERARRSLEQEAQDIFSLYEMTKELTRHFREGDVFHVFYRSLKERVQFLDCRIVDVVSNEFFDDE